MISILLRWIHAFPKSETQIDSLRNWTRIADFILSDDNY